MDDPAVVYSVKVEAEDLARAKKFFSRSGLQTQDVVRGLIKIAAECEACLTLVEAKAPIGQVQSSFASVLAHAKETWRLNGLFQEAILKTSEICELPQDFVKNVLAEAQRIYTQPVDRGEDTVLSQKKGADG